MNKKIIVILLLAFFSIGLVSVAQYLSYKSVSVQIKKPDVSITIYNDNDKNVSSLTESGEIKLKEGTYYYIPGPDIYSSDRVSFTISGSLSLVEVNPAYSDDYLASLLRNESQKIHTVLTTTYPEITTDYIISDERLYGHGDWYSTKLIHRPQGTDEPDVYRVILKKEESNWKIIVSPRLVIALNEFTDIPKTYINSVNEPLSNDAYSLLYF